MNEKPRIVVWFSCGAASAVTVKLVQAKYSATHDIAIVRCVVADEDVDNWRFAIDCEKWFGANVWEIEGKFPSAESVWRSRRYMSGTHGAPCTAEMKKAPRWDFEAKWKPDLQAYGFTAEEQHRADRFREQNPDVKMVTPLIEAGLGKNDCLAMVERAGLVLPAMYRLGYNNANCVGCVKGQGPNYWNRVRRTHPDVFKRRAELSRELNCRLVKLTTGDRERIFLDELPDDYRSDEPEPSWDCSLLCAIAETHIERLPD